jgi:hypothetical protein
MIWCDDLGDEVGDNPTRLPAPSLHVRGPWHAQNTAGAVAGPDKAAVEPGPSLPQAQAGRIFLAFF